MKTNSIPRRRAMAVLLVCTTVPAVSANAQDLVGCALQFDVAQRTDMESFRDFDAETFRAMHDERAVTVFTSGARRTGIDAIMATFASHFQNRNATWGWKELYRVVDGCRSAYILYETKYQIPSVGFRQRALTGVTYTHAGDHWVSISDQGTPLPWVD